MKRLGVLTFISLLIITFISCDQIGKERAKNNDEMLLKKKEGIIDVEGYKLKYLRKGEGDPLIIVGTSDYYSKAYSKELEKHYELIFVDGRHFAKDCNPSESISNNINLKTFSNDIDSIRKHLNLDKISLIGHSIQAQIALNYAKSYPEKLSRLILIAGVPYNLNDETLSIFNDENWKKLASEERKMILSAKKDTLINIIDTVPADTRFSIRYHYKAPIYWANPNYDDSKLWEGVSICPQAFGQLANNLPSKMEVKKELKNLSVQTLIINGKYDFAIPYQAWEEIIGDNPNIKYVLMENASHNPQTELSSQKEFDKHFLEWMK